MQILEEARRVRDGSLVQVTGYARHFAGARAGQFGEQPERLLRHEEAAVR